MLKTLNKGRIIGMKESGMSTRAVHRQTGYARETISKIWNDYQRLSHELSKPGADILAIQSEMTDDPTPAKRNCARTKFTPAVEAHLRMILAEEAKKPSKMGENMARKMRLTNTQIHDMLVEAGFDISRSLVNAELAKMRRKPPKVYVAQEHIFGERLEYDFGEVSLDCGDGYRKYHMAVFSAPASKFRWAFLFTNQKQDVFLDSHVKFFELVGGVWNEIVYDNMRNVVAKFIGKNEKLLNEELVKIAAYYGFSVNVTNCFSGNEKGSVERSVAVIRNQIFAGNHKFGSFEEARSFLHSKLVKMNENSQIEQEKQHLHPAKPPLDLAKVTPHTVNKLGMIQVNTCSYSVPEHLVGQRVIVKLYHEEVRIFAQNELVCTHKRIHGNGNVQICPAYQRNQPPF